MSEQQWEYCELYLGKLEEKKKKKGFTCDCYIRYYSSSGEVIHRQLATPDKVTLSNPYAKAIGLLGGASWELVSMQFGNKSGWDINDNALIRSNQAAWFKRPVVADRAVDEPKLALVDR